MKDETLELIIEMLAEKVRNAQSDAEWDAHVRDQWIKRAFELKEEVAELKKANKPKRGRPAKKRGFGRPKGSKNKVNSNAKAAYKKYIDVKAKKK